MEHLNLLIGLLGAASGGIVALLTIPSAVKKAKAEARSAEIDNLQKAVDSWQQLANERQEAYNELRAEYKAEMDKCGDKIDQLYHTISEWRDKNHALQESIAELKVYKATNEVKICLRRNCMDREPQSGY